MTKAEFEVRMTQLRLALERAKTREARDRVLREMEVLREQARAAGPV